jgi:serine protease Do
MSDFILKDFEGNIVRKTCHNVFYDEEYDYIKFTIAPNSEYTPLKIAEARPKIGDECFAIGNPKGMDQTLSSGIVSGFRDGKLIQTTAPITHGSSGCPLFNKQGEVIGIANGGIEGGGELNFAIDITFIGSHYYPDNLK